MVLCREVVVLGFYFFLIYLFIFYTDRVVGFVHSWFGLGCLFLNWCMFGYGGMSRDATESHLQ